MKRSTRIVDSLRCPFCESVRTWVEAQSLNATKTRLQRRRLCADCGRRFGTYETVAGQKDFVDHSQVGRLADQMRDLVQQLQDAATGQHIKGER
jgi:transcriptional regulator NrdR family protein